MTDTNLTAFIEAGEAALPHFEILADNSTLINPTNISKATGDVATVFKAVADSYNATGNLTAAFAPYESNFTTFSNALLGIADSWLAAGNELAKLWPNNFLSQYAAVLAFGVTGVIALVAIFIWWTMKRPSQ